MKNSAKKILHGTRQAVIVTVILMLICGLLFPCLLTGLSYLFFPDQAKGNLLTVNGKTVGAEYIGQEFTEDYFMWGRPSAYHYNVYKEGEDGKQYYSDGSEFGGLASGSNNYAPSNPALVRRVETDVTNYVAKTLGLDINVLPGDSDLLSAQINYVAEKSGMAAADLEKKAEEIPEDPDEALAYLAKTAGLDDKQAESIKEGAPSLYQMRKDAIAEKAKVSSEKIEEMIAAIPTDLMTASGSGLDPHITPESAEIQIPRIVKASGFSEEKVREIIDHNTKGKLLGIFGEKTVNVLEVNIEIAQNMGLV